MVEQERFLAGVAETCVSSSETCASGAWLRLVPLPLRLVALALPPTACTVAHVVSSPQRLFPLTILSLLSRFPACGLSVRRRRLGCNNDGL